MRELMSAFRVSYNKSRTIGEFMKKLIAIASALFLLLSVQPASAATKVTVLNQNKISTKTGLVKLIVTGLPKAHGIYISQCMGIEKGKTAPSACNPSTASKLWVSALPADQKMGATAPGKNLSIKIDKYFKDGDCIHTKCLIYVTNDHNAIDKTWNQAIPFKFGGINLF
jgi:hypothetical protein